MSTRRTEILPDPSPEIPWLDIFGGEKFKSCSECLSEWPEMDIYEGRCPLCNDDNSISHGMEQQ